ncbi:hypothetical protein Pint_24307 [Pistacia integerrima]|uniref:Uncharacterized protein n=1 Tax=Pistacia integerrima TaxID=434235 RepID=A0ACC0YBX2_9ROSI|nr:hypothetical protein Pint_24307 [Pistacia integerrima]
MLRGVENKREAVECCTLDGESPVAESITSLRSTLFPKASSKGKPSHIIHHK